MRTIPLLSLAAGIAAMAGCGTPAKKDVATTVPNRDLTLQTQPMKQEIASAVELQSLRPLQVRTQSQSRVVPTVRRAHRRSKTASPVIVPVALTPAPTPAVAPGSPANQAANSAAEPADPRELLPGTTVTVIPVSGGPTAAEPQPEGLPRFGTGGSGMGGGVWGTGGSGMGGGDCGGTGGSGMGGGYPPGIGIAARPLY